MQEWLETQLAALNIGTPIQAPILVIIKRKQMNHTEPSHTNWNSDPAAMFLRPSLRIPRRHRANGISVPAAHDGTNFARTQIFIS